MLAELGDSVEVALGRGPMGTVACELVKIQPEVIPVKRGGFGSCSVTPSPGAGSEQGSLTQLVAELSHRRFGFKPCLKETKMLLRLQPAPRSWSQ